MSTLNTSSIRVVKVGGAGLDELTYLDALATHIKALRVEGNAVVLVHGGGKEIGALHERLGLPFRRELGLRVTSDEGMSVVTMILCGLVNKRVVAHLNAKAIPAVGLSGADYGMMTASFLNEQRLGRVGGPPAVDAESFRRVLEQDVVLVLAPVSIGPDGGLLNVNADVAAQTVAVALGASSLDFVTDVEAVRTARGPVGQLSPVEIQRLVAEDIVTGGMIPKLQASVAAIDGGVGRVRVGNLQSLLSGAATEVHP